MSASRMDAGFIAGGHMAHLALDLSKRRTGWAMWSPGWSTARFGSFVLGSEYTSDGAVFDKLHTEMNGLWKLQKFENLYFEEPLNPAQLAGHTTIQTIWLLCGLAAHAQSYGHARRCRMVKAVNVENWRRDFIGSFAVNDERAKARRARKGGDKRASARDTLKALTIERCRQLGFMPSCNDEADAIGILDYSLALAGIVPPWRADETLRPILQVAGA